MNRRHTQAAAGYESPINHQARVCAACKNLAGQPVLECAYCKRIKNKAGEWPQMEAYGVLCFFITPKALQSFVALLTAPDLFEDPHDWIGTNITENPANSAIGFLLSHGPINNGSLLEMRSRRSLTNLPFWRDLTLTEKLVLLTWSQDLSPAAFPETVFARGRKSPGKATIPESPM